MKKASFFGMQSKQLSESLYLDGKSLMKSDLDIIQFFEHFDGMVSLILSKKFQG